MPNKVETLHHAIRHHAVLNALVALESVLSYPIPYAINGQLYLRFLVFNKEPIPGDMSHVNLHRPYARVSAEYTSGRLVEYVDLRLELGEPLNSIREEIGVYPHEAMADLSFEAAKAQRTALFYHTERMLPLYGRIDLTIEEKQIVQAYWQAFERVSEPSLRPHYETLSPGFFAWVKPLLK